MKKSLFASVLFAVSVVVAPVGVHAATSITVSNTGPNSVNKVKVTAPKGSAKVKVTNNNNVNANLATVQAAVTGNAKVKKNTTGGDALTGAAQNQNGVVAGLSVENTNPTADCGCAAADVTVTVEETGPDSKNIVKVSGNGNGGTNITNNNNINVSNTVSQTAVSGDATVKNNTTGGDATTGDASNTNSTSLTFTITNQN